MRKTIRQPKQHKVKYKGDGYFADWYVCTCGWKSTEFWDGAEYAKKEADQHLIDPKADKKKIRDMIDLEMRKRLLK